MAARRRTSARARAAELPALPERRNLPELARLARIAPSGRSVACSLALLALCVGGYFAARDTSLFAVRSLDVRGGTPVLRAQVRAALHEEAGKSLMAVDEAAIASRLAPVAGVRGFSFDRSFPHTLRIVVRPERPVLVLRQGDRAYLVASTGRVLRVLPHPRLSTLPRLWVTHAVRVVPGEPLPGAQVAAARALAPLRDAPLPGGVSSVRTGPETLTLTLGGGLEIRLGDVGDLRLKLAIARRILQATGAAKAGGGYVDVSVPERPVLDTNSQVGG